MMIIEKELRKKTTSGLKSSKTTTFILQNQTTMSEDHLHRTIKSIKLRMTIIQLKVIMLTKTNITSEVNSMKEHLKEEASAQEEEEEEKHL